MELGQSSVGAGRAVNWGTGAPRAWVSSRAVGVDRADDSTSEGEQKVGVA